MKKPKRFIEARIKLKQDHPHRSIPDDWFTAGRVLANRRPILNPRSLVSVATALSIIEPPALRGSRKLAAALDDFRVNVNGRVCLDLGASTGGFTRELLVRGARRVYAVDVGYGQLLGSLRQDARVINLERTNLRELSQPLVPDLIDVLTADLSYVPLSEAIGQLGSIAFSKSAMLVALVKPQFELGLPGSPLIEDQYRRAVAVALSGIERAGWQRQHTMLCPYPGAHGAVEYFVLAIRR